MQIVLNEKGFEDAAGSLLVAGIFKNESVVDSGLTALDSALSNQLQTALENGDFSGTGDQKLFLYNDKGNLPGRIMIIGLGDRRKVTPEKIRRAFGRAGKTARDMKITHASIYPPITGFMDEKMSLFTISAIEGFTLATYRYNRYRSRKLDKHPDLTKLEILSDNSENLPFIRSAVEIAGITVDATLFARDLVTTPGFDLYPQSYADIARSLQSERIKVEIIELKELKKLKMGALLAVGQGSSRPPVLIHLSYDPNIENAKTLAIVGKGITFDAGGLDLKTASGMRTMKTDMGGSAAVMGVFKALDRWQPKCRVEGFIPAAENLPDANAYKPGDVITSYKGLTIEIDNTDAEGRLALADAIAYAVETVKPDSIIDLATLTGACVIALGHHATGMMGTDENLASILTEAGEQTGERVWRLPLWDEYSEQITSEIADLKNTGGRLGGAITAGAFLKEFVDDTPWIHLDIAGTADESPLSYSPNKKLGTGVGVRLLLEVLRKWV
ncbi:leucyl aminopeptidase [Calditrichota bacterium]